MKIKKACKNLLKKNGVCVGFILNGYRPISWLAKQGKTEAVDFLITHFDASSHNAVPGYAMGGYKDKVVNYIK